MSRIGNNPVSLIDGVSVKVDQNLIITKGPKGQLDSVLPEGIQLKEENSKILISRTNDNPKVRALHGTTRMLLQNNIIGVSKGWEKKLELLGVGYRAQLKGSNLVFSLGFSHEVVYPLPKGVEAQVVDQTKLTLNCIDKQKLGQISSEIRNLKPPEPYKGKGIRYQNEKVRRKAGKSGKAGKK